jgi:hypothetical protein
MSNRSSHRERVSRARRKQQIKTRIIIGLAGLVLVAVIGFLLFNGLRPAAGEYVQVAANAGSHVDIGEDPGPNSSNPPTGGAHYASEYDAGFYDENDTEVLQDYPEGFLIHNLEHGYVIFWYNCSLLDDTACAELKSDIKNVMAETKGFKLIAFPWESLDVPLAMTSWDRIQEFETFDAGAARRFVKSNLNRSPEPEAN